MSRYVGSATVYAFVTESKCEMSPAWTSGSWPNMSSARKRLHDTSTTTREPIGEVNFTWCTSGYLSLRFLARLSAKVPPPLRWPISLYCRLLKYESCALRVTCQATFAEVVHIRLSSSTWLPFGS